MLHQVKFGESSIIVKVYTESHGLKSFIFKGVRKQKHRISPNLFEHLSLLELVFRNQDNKELQMAREVRVLMPFLRIPVDVIRSSMALFLNELVYKSLKEEEANPELFGFLYTSVELLDSMPQVPIDFHLWFAVQFTRFLGFYPMNNYSDQERMFDLKEGYFRRGFPDHAHYLEFPLSFYLSRLTSLEFSESLLLEISTIHRRELIRKLIEYYRLHLPGFSELKSPAVLEQVLE